MKKILITGSTTPDIDAVACAICYQQYLSQIDHTNIYVAGTAEGMHVEASFVLEKTGLSCSAIGEEHYDNYIIVDASEKYGLPAVVDFMKVQEVIDHRMFADYALFPNAKFRIEPVGAAATQIAEFFYFNKNVSISPAVAQLLLCAIYSNTVNFQANVTTFRDHRMKHRLETLVEDKELYREMFHYKTKYILDHLEEVMYSEDKTVDTTMKLFQLELYDATTLWERKSELLHFMEKLSVGVPQSITILQDIKTGQTSLVANNEATKKCITDSGLPGERFGDIWTMPHIMMRKTIIPFLRK